MGAPSKLTPETHDIIVGAIRNGATIEAAAALAGVTDRTVRAWLKAGEEERLRLVSLGHDPDDVDLAYVSTPELRFFRLASGVRLAEALREGELQARAHHAATQGSVKEVEEVSNGRTTRRTERTQDGKLAVQMLDRPHRNRPDPDGVEYVAAGAAAVLQAFFPFYVPDAAEVLDLTEEQVAKWKRHHHEIHGRAFLKALDAWRAGELEPLYGASPLEEMTEGPRPIEGPMASPESHPHLYAIGLPEYTGPIPDGWSS